MIKSIQLSVLIVKYSCYKSGFFSSQKHCSTGNCELFVIMPALLSLMTPQVVLMTNLASWQLFLISKSDLCFMLFVGLLDYVTTGLYFTLLNNNSGVTGDNEMRWSSYRWLVQERRNSIANALELHLSCTNLSIWHHSTDVEDPLMGLHYYGG